MALWSYARVDASLPEVDRLVDELHDGTLEADWPAGREHVLDRYRQLPFPFERLRVAAVRDARDWNLQQYLAYLSSWSASQRHLRRTGIDAVAAIRPAMSGPGATQKRCARCAGRCFCWSAAAEL